MPLSATANSTQSRPSATLRTRTATSPSFVNLQALPRPIRPERVSHHTFDVIGREAVAGDVMVDAVPYKPDGRPVSATQPRCRFDKRIEHGLQVERRTTDHL